MLLTLSLLLSTGGVRATLGRRLLCSRHNGRQPRGLPLHDHVQPQVLRHIMYADYKYQDRYFIILLLLSSLLLLVLLLLLLSLLLLLLLLL